MALFLKQGYRKARVYGVVLGNKYAQGFARFPNGVVGDQGEVVVMLLPADLVHSDVDQPVEAVGVELILAGAIFYMKDEVVKILNEIAGQLRARRNREVFEVAGLGSFTLRQHQPNNIFG